jgi:hypothetical protein
VRHVVQDLLPEPLPDQALRHLARPETRDSRRPAVVAGDTVDLRIHVGAGDLDVQVLARFTDVDELCLHEDIGRCGPCVHGAAAKGRPQVR